MYPGAYIRGLISGVLISGEYPGGLYLGNLYLGAFTGANIRGTYIWEIISGGLISGGLYPMTNIRGLISGAYISVHRFFKATVDKVPLKRLYVPELEKKTVVISI